MSSARSTLLRLASIRLALAALAVSLIAPAALAEPRQEQRSYVISYADLDMSTYAGGATLLGRIEKAARRICGNAMGRSLTVQRMAQTCREEVVARSVQSLSYETLTLAWTGKPGLTQLASR